MSGWICSYRQIWESPLFQGDGMRVAVWHWMLHHAAWNDVKFRVGNNVVSLSRGQVCASLRQIETATGMGRKALSNFLSALEIEGAIVKKTHQGARQGRTIITICNYDRYQNNQQGVEPVMAPDTRQERATKEQDKQINNIPTTSDDADAPSVKAVEVDLANKAVWDFGVQFLSARGVKNPRPVIGGWLKGGRDPIAVLAALRDAQRTGTQDPVPYVRAILHGGKSEKPKEGDLRALSPTRVQEFWNDNWVNRNDLTEAEISKHPKYVGHAPAYREVADAI